MSAPSVLVTGGSGFIGRYVVRELGQRGGEVTVLARRPWSDAPEGVQVLIGDVLDEAGLEVVGGRASTVVHLAWEGLQTLNAPDHVDRQLPGHKRFLQGLIDRGVSRVVVAGTCMEYGDVTGPVCETAPTCPENSYGRAKAELHRFLLDFRETKQFSLVWLRIFYVYGAGQHPDSLFSSVERAAGDGSGKLVIRRPHDNLDFIHVSEAATAIARLALSNREGIFNICSGRGRTVLDFARTLAEARGGGLQLTVAPADDGRDMPRCFWGSNDRARAVTD